MTQQWYISVDPKSAVDSAMGIERRLAHSDVLYTKLSADLQRSVRTNFLREGRPNRWKASRDAILEGRRTLTWKQTLFNSIYRRNTGEAAIVFTRTLYARIHEEGGIIRPVKKRALAIPIAKESKGLKPANFEGLFLLKRMGKAPLLMQRGRDGEAAKALFILLKLVRIPARPFIEPPPEDLEKIMKPRIERYVTRGEL